ncbi:MAG: NAD(P)H-dependent oxidoreductase subunit E [bacterium]
MVTRNSGKARCAHLPFSMDESISVAATLYTVLVHPMNTHEHDQFTEIDEIVGKIGQGQDALLPILQAIQKKYNYLPEPALRRVCKITRITPSLIISVATFYPQFRLSPAGQHFIQLCIGTACHVKGAESVCEAFRRHLEIPDGEDTDKKRLFTVEKVACLGCCMIAPAVKIDEVTYGFVTPQRVPHVLRDFLQSRTEQGPDKDTIIMQGREGAMRGQIKICLCSSCSATGAEAVYHELRGEISRASFPLDVKVVGCKGISYEAPLVEIILPDASTFFYGRVAPQDVRALLCRHFRPAGMVKRVGYAASCVLEKTLFSRYAIEPRDTQIEHFWGRQTHIVTELGGSMDPLDIDDYIRHDGFSALRQCTAKMAPDTIIATIKESGLRGRGGAGFPTGEKWERVRHAVSSKKYIVCNGDEGDPGAFMDRMILESFPFRVIEGMAIAAHALSVYEGYIYIRGEYPRALSRMKEALEICEERDILGPLRLKVIEGAGGFVCGEETALIAAIEGRRGAPRFRPPHPSVRGLWHQPTLINNVETFALVPWIIRHGPLEFFALGSKGSTGTKTFALAGKIARGGLIEVPMGITLREIVEDIGGGIPDGKRLKAIQVGGPSGGCVPAHLVDTPIDYEALTDIGAMMGSGGLVILDETDCMVDIARYFLDFTQRESCGKCTFCRIGTKRMLEILESFCQGRGTESDLEKLEYIALLTKKGSLCGLGKTAPNPVLSTLRYFRDEYIAHMEGRCPAKKCKALITYTIDENCIGCTRCAQRCPTGAIAMKPYQQHEIDQEKCIKCDTCRLTCPALAVKKN